jgi:hypothetical protein
MDLWLIQESESAEIDINILGATGSTVEGSPLKRKGVKNNKPTS